MNTPIGALVTFEWVNTDPPVQDTAYFSFGDYDDVSETDSFGVPDTRIFYYVDGAEAGLKEMMAATDPFEFKIISYDLTYPNERVVMLESDENAVLTLAEKLYFTLVEYLDLEETCIIVHEDGSTENTEKGEALYFLIEDVIRGE